MENLQDNLVEGVVWRKLIRFSLPLLASYLLQALYGSVDAYVVGRFSDLASITGVTQGSQITFILTSGVSGFGTAGTVLISQYAGAKNEQAKKESIETVFGIFVLMSIVVTVLILVMSDSILNLLSVPEEAFSAAESYLIICVSGTIFVFMYNCISCVLQALGDSRHPLIFVGVACIVNVILDIFLVAVYKMGATGAAIATIAAQMISVALSVVFLRRRKFIFDFKPRSFRIKKDKLILLMKMGIPYAFQRTVVGISFAAVSRFANEYGIVAASAAGIVSKINNFATLPYSALLVAISTMCGQNLGADNIQRAQKTFYAGLTINLAVGCLMFSCAQLIPGAMLGIFSKDPELISAGIPFLRLYSIEYLLMPFTFSIHGIIAGAGYTEIPMIDGLLASVLLRIPLCALFSHLIGFPGVALGSSLAVLGALIPGVYFYKAGYWKKSRISDRKSQESA